MPTADIGPLKMQNAFPRLVDTPGAVRWPGRETAGADNEEWLIRRLGLPRAAFDALKRDGVV